MLYTIGELLDIYEKKGIIDSAAALSAIDMMLRRGAAWPLYDKELSATVASKAILTAIDAMAFINGSTDSIVENGYGAAISKAVTFARVEHSINGPLDVRDYVHFYVIFKHVNTYEGRDDSWRVQAAAYIYRHMDNLKGLGFAGLVREFMG